MTSRVSKTIERWTLGRADRMGRDLRVARRRRQIVVAEQNLDDPGCRFRSPADASAKLWRNVCKVQRASGQPRRLDRRPAGCVQYGWINRNERHRGPGKQKRLWPSESPVRAQDGEKLWRQHHVAVLRAFAVTYQNDATAAVDILDPKPCDLRGPQSRRIGCRQRGAALQTRNGFEKSHDLIGAGATIGSLRGSRA